MEYDPKSNAQNGLIAFANRTMAGSYFDVASLTLLIVDYLATLDVEVRSNQHHLSTLTFRNLNIDRIYLACAVECRKGVISLLKAPIKSPGFAQLNQGNLDHTALNITPKTCQDMYRIGKTSLLAGILFAEAILFLRVYVLSGRNRKLMYYLVFQYVATHLTWISMFGVSFMGIEFGPSPIPTVLGCVILPPKKETYGTLLASMFGCLMVNEICASFLTIPGLGVHARPSHLAIVSMTFVIGLLEYRHMPHNSVITIFYRDGLFYFASLTACSVANMVIIIIGSVSSVSSITRAGAGEWSGLTQDANTGIRS
ncbi:hypothetical protein NMY22_g7880 [Coprinellus aureogranulatus]|nr:hypothetical protein NMY22_g7880 [Coprinellus aureogranulatus]